MKTLRQILGDDLVWKINDDRLIYYPDGFFNWLQYNDHVWSMFEQYSLTMAEHRERFSARTVVEVMRWNNTIRQEKDNTFKLSNNMTPGMARLWMAKWGDRYPKFFTIREG